MGRRCRPIQASCLEGSFDDQNYLVTVIEVEDVLPAVSHALAVIVWDPELTFFVFHVQVKGAAVLVHFTLPSTEMVTCEIATLSVADTDICTCPEVVVIDEMLAPLAGFMMATMGGVVSDTATLLTLTEIEALPIFPDES